MKKAVIQWIQNWWGLGVVILVSCLCLYLIPDKPNDTAYVEIKIHITSHPCLIKSGDNCMELSVHDR